MWKRGQDCFMLYYITLYLSCPHALDLIYCSGYRDSHNIQLWWTSISNVASITQTNHSHQPKHMKAKIFHSHLALSRCHPQFTGLIGPWNGQWLWDSEGSTMTRILRPFLVPTPSQDFGPETPMRTWDPFLYLICIFLNERSHTYYWTQLTNIFITDSDWKIYSQ